MPRPVTRRRAQTVPGLTAAALVAIAGLAAVAGGFRAASATTRQTACRLVEVGGYTLSARNTVGSYTHYASGGVDYRCADGVRIVADSAVGFETNTTLNLYGAVRFEDPEVILEAGQAIYFGESRYLRATHGSRVEYKNTGTVVSGEELDYYRQSEYRTVEEMTVRGGRPHATVYPQVASEAAEDPAADEEPAPEEAVSDDPPAEESPPEEAGAEDPPAEDSLPEGPGPEDPPDEELPPGEAASDDPPVEELPSEEAVSDDPPAGDPSLDEAVSDPPAADSLPEEPSAPEPPPAELPPYEIDADRFVVEGRRAFRAVNNVVLVRDSLRATGDTLYYDQDSGAMSLRGEPRVGDGRFDLTAQSVSITPATPGNENILASGEAALAGAAVAIEAPAIRLFLNGGDLGRLVALTTVPADSTAAQPDTSGMTPGDQARVAEMIAAAAAAEADSAADSVGRPSAYAEDLTLVADSIEVLSPDQTLQALTAVGTARAVAVRADSADEDTPEIARSDWMEGDTIVASFLPPIPGQGNGTRPQVAGRALLETLVAVGNARSLYRVPPDTTIAPEETPTGPPPLHWTQGDRITMHLADGEVVRMLVEGETQGYHFEPRPPSLPDSATAADSTAAVDSAAAADSTTTTDSTTGADSTTAVDSTTAADSTASTDSTAVRTVPDTGLAVPTVARTRLAVPTVARTRSAVPTVADTRSAVPAIARTGPARPWRRRP